VGSIGICGCLNWRLLPADWAAKCIKVHQSIVYPWSVPQRPKGDILYTEDDVMSPADYAAGFRRWAPEAPSEAGALIAEARKRYEREPLGWESKKKWQLRQDLHLHLCPSFILLCSPPLNGTVIKSDHYIVLANLTMTKTALTNAAFKPHWLPGKTLRGCAKSWSGFSKWGSLRVLVCACKV